MLNINNTFSVTVGILVALLSYLVLDSSYELKKLRKQAIEKNYALYDGKTGVWKWK